MKIRKMFKKINPWIGLIVSLCVILPSLYDILDDPYTFTFEYLILAGGIFFFILFLKQIFDKIIKLEGMD